jgi:hypothetical protein
LKVKFKYRPGIWREIECKLSNTLADLNKAIQIALDWDDDHLYSFFIKDKEYVREPEEYDDLDANKCALEMLKLRRKQKFKYVFDYGDEWKFDIEVIDFGTVKDEKYPKLLESKGKAPEQYSEDAE